MPNVSPAGSWTGPNNYEIHRSEIRLRGGAEGGTLTAMKSRLPLFSLALLFALVTAQAEPEVPQVLPMSAGAKPSVDGRVAAGEYAAAFTDAKTGIRVSWQTDAQNVYVALESAMKGWVAMGFGARGMRNASMVIGSTDKQGQWVVEEQMGKALYRHSKVESPKLVSGVAGPVEGKTVLEFVLPRSLSNGQTLTAGEPMPFILSCHKSKTKLSKHSKATSALLVLQEKPGSR